MQSASATIHRVPSAEAATSTPASTLGDTQVAPELVEAKIPLAQGYEGSSPTAITLVPSAEQAIRDHRLEMPVGCQTWAMQLLVNLHKRSNGSKTNSVRRENFMPGTFGKNEERRPGCFEVDGKNGFLPNLRS